MEQQQAERETRYRLMTIQVNAMEKDGLISQLE